MPSSTPQTTAASSIAELERRHGITRATLRRWRDVEGVDLADERALADRIAASRAAPQTGDLAKAKLEKLQAEIRRINFQHEVEKGKFVSATDQSAAGHQAGLFIRQTLEKLAADLPPRLAGQTGGTISKIINDEIRRVLIAFSQYRSSITQDIDK